MGLAGKRGDVVYLHVIYFVMVDDFLVESK